jgi:hypothetical protein
MPGKVSPAQVAFDELAAAGDCLSIETLMTATALTRADVVRFVGRLIAKGWCERQHAGCYRLSAAGRKAHAAGEAIAGHDQGPMSGPPAPRQDTLFARAWSAMRTLQKFTVPDLLTIGGRKGNDDEARKLRAYLKRLEANGYARRMPTRTAVAAGAGRGNVRWLLAKNTGPLAPIWSKKHGKLFDPNAGATIAEQIGEVAE